MHKVKIIAVCEHCGSTDVWADAIATWNENAQKWALQHVYDTYQCADCDAETSVTMQPVETEGV